MAASSFGKPTEERTRGLSLLDPRIRLILALGMILTTSILPPGQFGLYLVLLLLLYLAAAFSRVNLVMLLRRSLLAAPFALAALTLLVTVPGTTLLVVPVLGLEISMEGTIRFLSVLFKSWISVQAAIVLITLTDFGDLMWSLQALRMPSILVAIGSFGYRYLDVLRSEGARLRIARDARSAVLPGRKAGGGLLWKAKVTGWMIGSLMTRSLERSDRIYSAMLARGYTGQIRTLKKFSIRASDYGILAGAVVLFGLVLLISFLTK